MLQIRTKPSIRHGTAVAGNLSNKHLSVGVGQAVSVEDMEMQCFSSGPFFKLTKILICFQEVQTTD